MQEAAPPSRLKDAVIAASYYPVFSGNVRKESLTLYFICLFILLQFIPQQTWAPHNI